jgi:hypothetical protein
MAAPRARTRILSKTHICVVKAVRLADRGWSATHDARVCDSFFDSLQSSLLPKLDIVRSNHSQESQLTSTKHYEDMNDTRFPSNSLSADIDRAVKDCSITTTFPEEELKKIKSPDILDTNATSRETGAKRIEYCRRFLRILVEAHHATQPLRGRYSQGEPEDEERLSLFDRLLSDDQVEWIFAN